MTRDNNKRKLIAPAQTSLARLIFFWLLVFAVPIATCKIALSIYCESSVQEAILRDSEKLKLESESFSFDLKIENMLMEAIADAKNALIKETEALAALNAVNNEDLTGLSKTVSLYFSEKHQLNPELCIISNSSSKQIDTFFRPESVIKPGKKSAEILLSHLDQNKSSSSDVQKKRYHQIVTSIFGNLLDLPERPGLIRSGFFAKGNRDRLFLYYDHLPEKEKKPGLTFLLVFSENSIRLRHLLKYARKRQAFPGTKRSFAMLSTAPDRDFAINNNGRICFAAPISPATLRIGSHVGKSWYDRAINDGSAIQKPSKLPFIIVSADSGRLAVSLVPYLPFLHILMMMFLFLGLALIKQALSGNFAASTLQQRFKFAILFTTVLPFAAFMGTSHQFSRHFNNAMITSQMQNISNDVHILEMNILSNDLRERRTAFNFIAFLHKNRAQSEKELRRILDSKIGSLYEGYAMLRSDGLFIEKLPDRSIASVDDYNKLIVVNDIHFGQFYNVFSLASALKPEFAQRAAKYPNFLQWKAYSVHFTEIDRDAFCQQDGSYFMTKNAEKPYYRLSIHNLFPEIDKTELWAGLMLIQNVRTTVEKFMQSQTEKANFAIKRNGGVITHTAVFRCHDEAEREVDSSYAWPKSALNDKEMLDAAHRLNNQKREASWISYDTNGMATLFSVRALSDLPFIMVSKATISDSAVQTRLLWVIITCLLIYLMLLVALLSTTLSEIFLKPINLLLAGINLLEQGNYPLLQHSSSNELGKLIDQFNSMADGMRQRQLLERFISDELSLTITQEAQHLHEHSANLVFRVIMFIHIRDFAGICERLPPEHAILLLNHYFSALEPHIHQFGGQIDKYIGDAIMVSFSQERTADQCEEASCKAAIACKSSLSILNTTLLKDGLPQINIGVGIAGGMVIIGKIGAKNSRKDFTLIGNPVNLAARLEANSHFDAKSHILIDNNVAKELSKHLPLRFYKEIQVKGKAIPVKVYELAGANK